jgi:hypothetical protein
MRKPLQNLGVSVRARLLNLARECNQPFELLLIRYTLERLLYRLSKSAECTRRERELRIERFMTAGFASRPLREGGGVSRNRQLADKMIVWRTILGLIMASKWPEQSHNLLAVIQ